MENEEIYALLRLISGGDQTKTLLPLRLNGTSSNVPTVTNLKVSKTRTFTGGTEVTLTWVDCEDYRDNISKYDVYLTSDDSPTPTVVASPKVSPARVLVQTSAPQKVTLRIQTVLKNGQVSDFALSPTTTALVTSVADTVSEDILRAFSPQPSVTQTADVSAGNTSLTLVNYTGAGKFIGAGFRLAVAFTGGNAITLRTVVDGITTNQNLYVNGGTTVLNGGVLATPGQNVGGLTVGDYFYLPMNLDFNTSLGVYVDVAGSILNVGQLECTAWYAKSL